MSNQTRDALAEALGAHRWKSMGVASVECECGDILYGDSSMTQFPADARFRQHLADAILASPALAVPVGVERVEYLWKSDDGKSFANKASDE
jgi:hypothetical protein